ncbi:MAG: pimeloyl-ACP methyl ester carboxylesterase [Candidatus Poriferisodalaceae bacterium]
MNEPQTIHIPSEDGVVVAAHDYGGEGHPIVFVHGTGLCSRMWEPVIELMPRAQIRPIAIDLRGHGATTNPDDVTFFDHRMVADVTAVIDHFGIQGGAVAAHSMGAATALLSTLTRPAAFTRVWAYEPIIFPLVDPPPEGLIQMLASTRRRRVEWPDRDAVIERYGSRFPLDELHPACLAAYVQHGFDDLPNGSVALACDPEQEARAFEQFLQQGWEQLPDISVATRIAYGGKMLDRSGSSAPDIAARLPNSTVDCFHDSAHFGPFGDIDHAARSITEWCVPS